MEEFFPLGNKLIDNPLYHKRYSFRYSLINAKTLMQSRTNLQKEAKMANTLDCYVKFNQLTVCVNMKFCLLVGKLEPCSFFLSFFLTIKLQYHYCNIEFY